MNTANELQTLVGKEGSIQEAGLVIGVRIKDAKVSYGRPRVLVTPIAGSGETWRAIEGVEINQP